MQCGQTNEATAGVYGTVSRCIRLVAHTALDVYTLRSHVPSHLGYIKDLLHSLVLCDPPALWSPLVLVVGTRPCVAMPWNASPPTCW